MVPSGSDMPVVAACRDTDPGDKGLEGGKGDHKAMTWRKGMMTVPKVV